ncbi:hypothetical protein KIH87_02665 [Paraneptunicella aestuarii]|uniref:peroxidase family protein n=1 Tax=Paraneptunicella aestuarii TaxID=2831148 RepID=UPI001E29E1F9|nr:peroxidase family protein [Paraneptunicella aestuarii]UAA39286.1 hypothetical protein KIH87_02665 [Paraneptunicella aestuarii]
MNKTLRLSVVALAVFSVTANAAQTDTQTTQNTDLDLSKKQVHVSQQAQQPKEKNETSPARQIIRQESAIEIAETATDVRTYDGTNNNLYATHIGSTHQKLVRYTVADYSDGISKLAGLNRNSARSISNYVLAQTGSTANFRKATDYLWQWGQFLDHDIDLTDGVSPAEPANIKVPLGDPYFDPDSTGTSIPLNRSIYDEFTGTDVGNPRQQINEITAWIDASNVYGSSLTRVRALRTFDGTGKLRTYKDKFLPFNVRGLPNAGGDSDTLFLAGDVRANEQVGLTAMHTLFVREHNRLATLIAQRNPSLSGEEIFQQARKIVGAQMQVITYNEFLPVLLGKGALSPYAGYNPKANPSIANEFSTAAYRLGHSLLSPTILRLDANLEEISGGHLPLRDSFFAPKQILEYDIDPILRGLAHQTAQELDSYVIDDVRNFLFGQPGNGGFDLASLNIQRGRDHGLPSYNYARKSLGLGTVSSFAEITSDTVVQEKLKKAYGDVNSIDLWVGGLAEDNYQDAMVGELFFTILKRQFERLRDGDRFWYQNYLTAVEQKAVASSTLADIIRRNTDIGSEIQEYVFLR